MTALALLQGFAVLHVLVAVGYGAVRLSGVLGAPTRSRVLLSRALMAATLLLAFAVPFAPSGRGFVPPAQVYTSLGDPSQVVVVLTALDRPPVSVEGPTRGFDVAAALVLLGALGVLLRGGLHVAALRRLVASTRPWRRVGRVELRVSPDASFAAWLPGRAIVAVEAAALGQPDERRLAVLHELQHHRHRDPAAAWGVLLLRAATLYSPFVEAWAAHQRELEELAVDAAVAARPTVSRRAYAAALLGAARRAVAHPAPLSAGLTSAGASLLHRRIDMLTRPTTARRGALTASALVATFALCATAYAGSLAVDDHRLDDGIVAEGLAAAGDDAFPFPTDGPVVDRLQRLAGSERGRDFARRALAGRVEHAALVDDTLAAYGLPPQLAAIPLVESGYANLAANPDPSFPGAGLWQFIPETARSYGLTVDGSTDERLDLARSTDAAARLLVDLHAEFGDWGLALAAYNQGSRAVAGAVAAEGTRDVSALIEAGALNDYAAQVMAAAVVLERPSLVV